MSKLAHAREGQRRMTFNEVRINADATALSPGAQVTRFVHLYKVKGFSVQIGPEIVRALGVGFW